MSLIRVSNLSFRYDSNYIFSDVSFDIDTNWKLGFIGRNGKGKTTFLKLLLGREEYIGSISSNVSFDYFPFDIKNENKTSYEIADDIVIDYEKWMFDREVSLLDMDPDILSRPFNTLSKGEQTKIMLSMLFLRENTFLLIDEPTNHLDFNARNSVANYLNKKKGFILVSHDRDFLDKCVDHILSINRTNIEIEKGNFSSWYENKVRRDNFELSENDRLKKDISRLEESARKSASWSDKVEKSKYNAPDDIFVDKGYIGHKSAKMMKRAIVAQNRKEKAITEKSKLLKNIEVVEDLKLNILPNRKGRIIDVSKLSIIYNDRIVVSNIGFYLEDGDRLQIKGKNGSGKSSIIKLILDDNNIYKDNIYKMNDLKISYVSQDTSNLSGLLSDFIYNNKIDETLFKTILRKMDFDRDLFTKDISSYSEGQKKKVLLAKSLSESANIYIWDEPLNYLDIFSRIQIENLILKYKPTLIFVEHDNAFSSKIATKVLDLDNINKY